MPRSIPQFQKPPAATLAPGIETRSYTIELVTPMFGGGVKAGEPDPSMPIRPTEIRGQLRFWWRATRGANYLSCTELRNAEGEIWGTTDKASRVIVRVEAVDFPKPEPCATYQWNPNARGGQGGWRLTWNEPFLAHREVTYALFPFQGKQPPPRRNARIDTPPAKCFLHGSFKLILEFPKELSDDVETALRAWLYFGGLGARTRRGCGSLWCKDLAPQNSCDLQQVLTSTLTAKRGSSPSWPVWAHTVLIGNDSHSPLGAWEEVIKLLKKMRQGIGLGRDPGRNRNRPGRSRWPEAESVREITGYRSPARRRQQYIPNNAFPRAEFGLPIVFHFKDQGDPPGNPQDDDYVLYPKGTNPNGNDLERMASPLILKPLALTQTSALPLIVWLQTPELCGVELRQGNTRQQMPPGLMIRDPNLATYQNSPMQNLSNNGSALEALINLALTSGFQRII